MLNINEGCNVHVLEMRNMCVLEAGVKYIRNQYSIFAGIFLVVGKTVRIHLLTFQHVMILLNGPIRKDLKNAELCTMDEVL